MRNFIKSFLFTVFLLLPNIVIAEGCGDYTADGSQVCEQSSACIWDQNNNQCTERCPTNNNTCTNWSGCYLDETNTFGSSCAPCGHGTYNNTNGANACTPCSSFSYSTGQIFDTAYANTYGLSTCPWICDKNYYKSNDGNSCVHCPTGALSPAGSDNVNGCICPTDTPHLVYNNGTYSCEQCSCTQPENGSCTATYNKTTRECQTTFTCNIGYYDTESDTDSVSCTACPSNSTTDNTGATSISECKCNSGYYRGGTNMNECIQCPDNSTNCISDSPSGLTAADVECDTNYQRFESDGVVTCEQCPEHSKYNTNTKSCECANGANGTFGINSTCACANNSDYNGNNNECECTTAPHLNPTYDNNGVLTCSSCADNAIYENGCKCKVGYYGDGDTNCEQCPNHSTTDDAGSTSISACKCNIGYYDTESDTDSVSCTKCPNNSTTDGAGSTSISACKCNVGYYDTESDTDSVSCTKCPIGMTTVTLDSNGNPTNTTTNGATSIEHCAMLATSDFCFTNPDSTNRQLICTPLILPGATKINGRTISTTTNSGN